MYSFYSTKKVAQYRFQGIGKTFLFIFLLSIVSILSVYFTTKDNYDVLVNKYVPEFRDNIPEFKVENGELKTSSGQDEIYQFDDFTVILSPDSIRPSVDLTTPIQLELLKDKVSFTADNRTETINYKDLATDDFSSDFLKTTIDDLLAISNIFYLIFLIFSYIITFIMLLIQISILGLISMILSRRMNKYLKYKQLWILSSYGIVIPTVFVAIMESLNRTIPFQSLIFWFSALYVMYNILKEVPDRIEQ
jgi:hypothetical protein